MGNQVSSNLKNSLLLQHQSSSVKKKEDTSSNQNTHKKKQTIGILSFEVANVMSKVVHLHKSLTDQEISRLKFEIVKSEGVRKLVSSDEKFLLELACAEKLDDLNRVGEVVSRLGKKCSEPALLGFQHVFGDILSGVIDVKELGFLVKDMDGMIRKMERYISATCNLYSELEVLNELEQAAKKFQQNQLEESRRAVEQKLSWQKQDVKHLKDVSLWNQTYDKIVESLARTVCTIYARICVAYGPGNPALRKNYSGKSYVSGSMLKECGKIEGKLDVQKLVKKGSSNVRLQRVDVGMFHEPDFSFPCGPSPGRIFMECLSLSSSASRVEDDDGDYGDRSSQVPSNGILAMEKENLPFVDHKQLANPTNGSIFGAKSKLAMHATPSTIGGSALALHYANVIIVIEKLLRYPHLVGEEARDDLYQMLPTSLRKLLNKNLKSYFKNMAIYDAPLVAEWREKLEGILKWVAPLAHNMIRWQSERNFEQQQIVKRTNVLLLQTLYFADREKTESAICQILMGLNYICRYEQQQNALLDCASSFDFGDWMEWQLQCQASCLN